MLADFGSFSTGMLADGFFARLLLGERAPVWASGLWAVGLMGVFLGVVGAIGFLGIWWERKVSARIQARHGPNRVGPMGILQSLADGIKLITKEDLTPAGADKLLFKIAPYLAFAPVFAAFLALPFGPDLVYESHLTVGIFWVLAILGVEVIGVILAGWASNSKWSMYGAMREACQLVSYEIPLGLSIVTVVLFTGTLDLLKLTEKQAGGAQNWLIFSQPFIALAFVVFFVASLASNKRAPFDLPESESELVAGYHTEYSGMRFGVFFLGEYAAMFLLGGLVTVIFLGSWHDPVGWIARTHARLMQEYLAKPTTDNTVGIVLLNMAACGCFCTKVIGLIFVQMWVRWTLPRPRIDQVLHVCMKVLIPAACGLMVGSAIWTWLVPSASALQQVTRIGLTSLGAIFIAYVAVIILAAFISGRRTQKRVTDPGPLEVG